MLLTSSSGMPVLAQTLASNFILLKAQEAFYFTHKDIAKFRRPIKYKEQFYPQSFLNIQNMS